jgi:hypothetical protein
MILWNCKSSVVVRSFLSFNVMYRLVAQNVFGLAVVAYDWIEELEIATSCSALWKR